MKNYKARPWLVALGATTAALAAWHGRDALISLPLLRVTMPLAWPLLTAAAAGLVVLVAMASPRRRPDARGHSLVAAPLCREQAPGPAAANPEPSAAARTPCPADPRPSFEIELDHHSRITRCQGLAANALAADPRALEGSSLLELVPARMLPMLVETVRAVRAAPGETIELPKFRLQRHGSGRESVPTEPLKLTMAAHADGSLVIRGVVADAASPVPIDSPDDRFSRVFHSSPDAIVIIRHHDGAVIDFNASFTRLLGHSREQAIGRPITDLDLWEDAAARRTLIETFTRQRKVTDAEATLKSSDGRSVPVEISLRFIEVGGDLCVLGVARDITKRLEAELAARESEQKFRQVFTQSPDGVLILRRRDLVIRDVNPAFVRGSGFASNDLIGQPLSVLEEITDAGSLAHVIELLSRDGRVGNLEMRLSNLKGREVTALVSGTATEIDGEPSLLCIIKDITELRHAQEQLRRSEARFRGAFENAPIGILLLDPQGHIFQANRFATELLHYPEGALDSVHVSRLVPTDERADLKEQIERLVRANEVALRSERRMVRADGLEIWTNCHIVLQRGGDGEPLYSIMQVADITEMKTSQQQMERLAFYDTLTELANRRLFNDRLQQAVEHCRRHRVKAALLYLDLDQFKRVNDTLGHESGDRLLKEVGRRLLGCVRREDTVGRPGGDEFTILLYGVETADDAGRVAEKILRELEYPITVSGHQLVVTTSIGITVIPDDGTDPNALTKNADLAMYRAKEKGRNNFQFFSEDLNTTAVHRLRTEYELRRALERSEFELYFQPMVRVSDRAIVGVECLLRWNHPERGLVMPQEFIGIAEETGAIGEIGSWVIEEACAAGRLMSDQHGSPLNIAVNISPRQFRDPHLVASIRQSLARAQLRPGLLELEITETMLMEDVEVAAGIVGRLHDLGVRLAIDDFGTGYSSLNYLKKFPISTVRWIAPSSPTFPTTATTWKSPPR